MLLSLLIFLHLLVSWVFDVKLNIGVGGVGGGGVSSMRMMWLLSCSLVGPRWIDSCCGLPYFVIPYQPLGRAQQYTLWWIDLHYTYYQLLYQPHQNQPLGQAQPPFFQCPSWWRELHTWHILSVDMAWSQNSEEENESRVEKIGGGPHTLANCVTNVWQVLLCVASFVLCDKECWMWCVVCSKYCCVWQGVLNVASSVVCDKYCCVWQGVLNVASNVVCDK